MYNNYEENTEYNSCVDFWPKNVPNSTFVPSTQESMYEEWMKNKIDIETENSEGKANMSILVAEIVDNSIIMMSDSRSTKIVGGQYPHQEYNDKYKKIIYFPDSNVIIGSTGLNDFHGKNLQELSQNIYDSVINTGRYIPNSYDFIEFFIKEMNKEIKKCVMEYNSATAIVYGFFKAIDKDLMGVKVKTSEPHLFYFNIKSTYPYEEFMDISLNKQPNYWGEIFTIDILKHIYIPQENDVKIHYDHYKTAMKKIISLEKNFFTNSVIGGTISAYAINSNGIITM